MTEEIKELLKEEIRKMSIDEMDKILGYWEEHKYINNDYESKEEYEERKKLVTLTVIEEKLQYYEQEY